MPVGLSNTSTASTNLAALSYNTNGLISTITLKDSSGASLASENLLYDGALRPASATTTWTSSNSTIYSDAVSYDNVGNALSRATTQAAVSGVTGSGGSETQNFCYNEQNQLVRASNATVATPTTGQTCGSATLQSTLGGSYNNTYVYTHLGQLWQGPLNGNGTQEQYLYCNTSQPHQLTALSPASGSPTCSNTGTMDYSASYDAWGNLTSRTYSSTTSTPVYDPGNQMIRWSSTTSTAANEEWYLYDANGNRVMRRSASTTSTGNPATAAATITVYAFGLEEHTYSYAGSGSSLTNTGSTYYYSLGGRLIGSYNGTSTNFYLTDLLGSVVSTISNTAGSAVVLGSQIYGPYGNQRYSAGSVGTSKGFTGQYNDNLTGLDYYNARYYDPVTGRFTSADIVQGNTQGADPYAYVGGNPETNNDPTGQLAVGGGAGGGGGASIDQIAYAFAHHQKLPNGYSANGMGFLLYLWLFQPQLWTSLVKMGGGKNLVWMAQQESYEAYAFLQSWQGTDWFASGDLRQLHAGLATSMFTPGTVGSAFPQGAVCGQSFTATTVVTTENGKQEIKDLRSGEKVWAYNPQTGKKELQPVTHIWIDHDNDLIDITLALTPVTKATKEVVDGTKQHPVAVTTNHANPASSNLKPTETIHTTQKHPWLTTKGWIKAGDLHLGDQVLRLDDTTATVTKLLVIPGTEDMYDLTVNQIHTFAVGEDQFVVHNCTKEEAIFAQSLALGLRKAFVPDNNSATVDAAFWENPDSGEVNLFVSMNTPALRDPRLAGARANIAAAIEPLGGEFISEGADGAHAELNIINSPSVLGLTPLGEGASANNCTDCGPVVRAVYGEDGAAAFGKASGERAAPNQSNLGDYNSVPSSQENPWDPNQMYVE